ncbi:MAG: sugar phosphate isomerase/epimerase [Chloroflexota bacterium]
MNNDKIAVQLYTLRDLTSRDMLGTLRELAAMGYSAVELAGYGDSSPADIRAELDRLGMRAISMHIGVDALKTDAEKTLADARTLGCEFAVVAYVAEERRRTAEQVREFGPLFNSYGAICRDAGLRFVYHNHNFEFAPLDGTTMFDMLVEGTDPMLVGLELDVYWAQFAGVDPVAVLKRLAGRVPLLHAKDMADDEKRSDMPVGEGMLPWNDILAASAAAGVEYYIVEQDNPRDPLPDVAQSLQNLRKMPV